MMPYDEHYSWLVEKCSSGEGNLLVNSNEYVKNDQLTFLIKYLLEINPSNILEVGTNCACFGYMIHHILPQAKLITLGIDWWSKEFVDYFNNAYGDYISFILGDSQITLPKLESKIDLAWVDGCHTPKCLMSDLTECSRLEIPHIFIDDYEHTPLTDTVDEFIRNYPKYKIKDQTNNHQRDIVYLARIG